MSLFSKKIQLTSPVNGNVKDIVDIEDLTFSQKLLGDGVAIEPNDGIIVAPADATVEQVFHTKHAITLDIKGLKVLLHIGMDTVNLKGQGFEVFVNEGDKVSKGDKLVQVDLDLLKQEGYTTDIALVIVNMEVCKDMHKTFGPVEANKETILEIKK